MEKLKPLPFPDRPLNVNAPDVNVPYCVAHNKWPCGPCGTRHYEGCRCFACVDYRPDMAEIRRHPSAVAFDAWLRTPEGLRCAEGLTGGEYLQNRLWFAFMAGYTASESAKAGVK